MRLLIGRAISALATALIPTTITLAVLRATNDAGAVGTVLACEAIPLLVFLPVGGVVADRVRPERLALVTDLVRGLTQAAIAIELLTGAASVPRLAVLAVLAGVAVAFGLPAVPRLVAAAVPGPERLRVNARLGVATSLAAVLAPALAGGVVLLAGPGWAALLTAALFACSALTLGGVRTAKRSSAQNATFLNDLREGWGEVRRRPWFLAAVLAHGVWHFMAGLFLTLGPLAAVKELGGEASWVLIVQSGTVGLVAGVFAAPRLPIRRPLVAVQVGAALYVLPMAALALPVSAWMIAGAYFVAMFGLGVLSPLWETVVAEEIPEAALGRVRSFDQLISFATRPFGLAMAAPLAGLAGARGLLLTGAIIVAVANLAAIATFPRRRGQAATPEHPKRVAT
ncbi:MFS transporter [Nonomuraea sp. NPDC050451]|uniref:MFS transporter n=1 Tax=Nonomuraea sp. NPDC050451 TaxID=3364364 RepID=UPI0037927172